MEWLLRLGTALIFALSCNLDTILLSASYAVRGIRVGWAGVLVISLVTTAVTWLSLMAGELAAAFFAAGLPNLLGGGLLVGFGCWCLLDCLTRFGQGESECPTHAPDLWRCVALAAALAVNNAGIGVAAGVAGIGVWLAAAGNFVVTALAFVLGRAVGTRVAGQRLGQYALPLSGALLVLLGLGQIFNALI